MNELEDFLTFEKENNLFKYKYKGVHFWALIRFEIYLNYYNKATNGHPDLTIKDSNHKYKILKLIPKQIISRIFIKRKDIFCTDVNIYKVFNGKKINPYIDFFREVDLSVHYHTSYNPILSDDIIYNGTNDSILKVTESLKGKYYKLKEKLGYKKSPMEIKQCLDILREKLNIQIEDDYENKTMHLVLLFLSRKNFYKKLIRNKFKCVVLVDYCNVDHMSLVSATRELGIPSVDLLHGMTGEPNIALNFFDLSFEDKYLPDYLFTFGEHTIKTSNFPEKTIPLSMGFPQMDISKDSLKEIVQDEKKVVFYSTGDCGNELSRLAIEVAEAAIGFTVKYKLHPTECKSWKTLYPQLIENENIEVIDKPMNVHELSASAKYHVGVSSTTLFEALAFNGTVFIYNMEGAQNMKSFIENGYVYLINNKDELLKLLESNSIDTKNISDYLFKPNAIRNIEAELCKIIKSRNDRGDDFRHEL